MKSMEENINFINEKAESRLDELKLLSNKSCEYCDEKNTEENLKGGHEGIIHNRSSNKNRFAEYYLFINHFHNEFYRIEVKFCPQCGRELK